MSPNAIPGETNDITPIYLSCSPEDLVCVEIVAWTHGRDRAGLEVPPTLKSIEAVEEAAEAVCDKALRVYIPLDVGRFRDVFTRAWSAGYCSQAGLIVAEKPRAPEGEIH